MKSETRKLPRGHSYPLRPTALEAALEGAGIDIDTHLIRAPGSLFDAHFWPSNRGIAYERLYVRAGSVPIERAPEARQRAETVLLPALIRWLADILGRDPQSPVRREEQVLDLAGTIGAGTAAKAGRGT